MDQYFDIIALFEQHPFEGRTIRQISQALQRSYGWAHAGCTQLLEQHILTSQHIGASIVCLPNLNNELTQALLTVASVQHKQQALTDQQLAQEAEDITRHAPPSVAIIFHHNNTWHAIGSGHSTISHLGGHPLTWHNDQTNLRQFSGAIILIGQQSFWRMMSRA